MSAIILLALILACGAIVAISARDENIYSLRGTVAVMMICIMFLAGQLVEIGPFRSNVANVFFAFALYAQWIILARGGAYVAWRIVGFIMMRMTFVAAVSWLFAALPIVEGNEVQTLAIRVVANHSLLVVAASFLAFCAGSFILIQSWRYTPQMPAFIRFFIATATAQTVDSLFFFFIVFFYSDQAEWWQFALVGAAFKIAIAVGAYSCAAAWQRVANRC